jgi:hypothetical protein
MAISIEPLELDTWNSVRDGTINIYIFWIKYFYILWIPNRASVLVRNFGVMCGRTHSSVAESQGSTPIISKRTTGHNQSYQSLDLGIIMSHFHPSRILTTCFAKIDLNVTAPTPSRSQVSVFYYVSQLSISMKSMSFSSRYLLNPL